MHLFPSSPAAPCLLLLLLLVALFSSFSSFLAEEADGALSLLATPSDTFREETSLVNDDTCENQKRKKQIIFFILRSTAAVVSRLGRASTMLPLDRALTLCLHLLYVCIPCFLLPYTCILYFLLPYTFILYFLLPYTCILYFLLPYTCILYFLLPYTCILYFLPLYNSHSSKIHKHFTLLFTLMSWHHITPFLIRIPPACLLGLYACILCQ